ncbi:MAG: PilZ domain-containing protein [Armatimonadota bacterium]|nr:PilZ domain-containing protein [Armatimonadota bacterium]MDR7486116.1 PilZ domain-containing protein [Armatimonadota bacterium]MDR7531747.1 PilZ domain-containing protein [Armatimonadota bacterium]MDR7534908.1 PilZ domain-containing protein [Armatimonadota bacterium]
MAWFWRPRRQGVEQRMVPRIPLAVPVRYGTDRGHAGIGVLIDVTERGAGLLVHAITPDAGTLWIRFLWFDDQVGVQGRVVFIQPTPEGQHIGVRFRPLPGASRRFITDLLIPYGLRKFRHDRRHPFSLLQALAASPRPGRVGQCRRRYLPVLVEQGDYRAWAVTEDRTDEGALLLVPHPLQADAAVRLTTWGTFVTRYGMVDSTETLALPPVTLHRLVVRFVDQAVGPAAGEPPRVRGA